MTAFLSHNPFTCLGKALRMEFTTGTWIVIGAVLLFYLRLITLQFGRVRQARYKAAAALKKDKKKSGSINPQTDTLSLGFKVKSWYLVGAGIALMVLGAVMGATSWMGAFVQSLWWIPVTIGIGFFAFSFR